MFDEEINQRFRDSRGTTDGGNTNPHKMEHAKINAALVQLAEYLDEELPEGRYKSLAFTELEMMSTWVHKAIEEKPIRTRKFGIYRIRVQHGSNVLSTDKFAEDQIQYGDLSEDEVRNLYIHVPLVAANDEGPLVDIGHATVLLDEIAIVLNETPVARTAWMLLTEKDRNPFEISFTRGHPNEMFLSFPSAVRRLK